MEQNNNAVCYIRMGSAFDEFNFAELQRSACINTATQLGVDIIHFYEDIGLSNGNSEGRKGLTELLTSIESGEVKYVLAYSADRLFRDQIDYISFKHFIAKHGVTLHLVQPAYLDII
jgi:DNA invertase Pin-like site-specific DNA recombinase